MSVITWLLGLFSLWWVWLPIVALLLYLTIQNHRRIKQVDKLEHTLLLLEVPRTNDRDATAAEALLNGLHGLLRSKKELVATGEVQEHFSLEMVAAERTIQFYLWVPKHLQHFAEGQLYTHYPHIQIHEVTEDYSARQLEGTEVFQTVELTLNRTMALPIKTFGSFETDPLTALATTLGKLDQKGEQYWIQILVRPTGSAWQRKAAAYTSRLKQGRKSIEFGGIFSLLGEFVSAFWRVPQPSMQSGSPSLSSSEQAQLEACERKQSKPGFQVKIRLAYSGPSAALANSRLQALAGTFKQFGTADLNSFSAKRSRADTPALAAYRARFFIDKGFVLNTEELATIFHLPSSQAAPAHIAWAKNKATEPPAQLPALTGDHSQDQQISAFASTHFRGIDQQFGLLRADRDRHVYVIGQTGVGKSKLLELFALSDLYQNQGYAIIDPHGDFAINNLYFVPPSRVKDVVYFNLADTDFPIGFNPLEVTNPALKGRVSAEIISVLRHLLGSDSNTRLEAMLRNIVLALLETKGSILPDIPRMLADETFREYILGNVTDPVVKSFWQQDFPEWSQQFAGETTTPILNKLGAFTSHPIIRNIISQPVSSFNLRQLMDQGKILIVNLSGSLLGEENAALLGSLLITKIQQAAMSRTDPANRRPFYLYVDEFQNFATDSFVPILSEARKYGLGLTMANQYIAQMSPLVRDAIFGNVGAMIAFRIGADDAAALGSYFLPSFSAEDLTQLHNRHFAVSMSIRGEKTQAFSGTTLALPATQQNYIAEIVAYTRQNFCLTKDEVANLLVARSVVPDKPSATAIRRVGNQAREALITKKSAIQNTQENSFSVAAPHRRDEFEMRIEH